MSADRYLQSLAAELSAAGIRGRLRSRILDEFADHLACDPDSQPGAPQAIARQFADELGSSRIRQSALAAFTALALAGALFGLAILTATPLGHLHNPRSSLLGRLALGLAVLAPQVAFAAGTLAALRALLRRRARSLPRREAVVIARRVAIAIAAGLLSMAALALTAVEYRHAGNSSWREFAIVAAAAGALGLLAAVPMLVRAMSVRPDGGGGAGDIFDDLPPLGSAFGGRPLRFAATFACAVGLVVAVAGIAASDPFDGILRGVAETLACLTGFALLGPYLGLWRPTPPPPQ